MGRQLKDTIPIHNSKVKPKVPSYVQKHLKIRQYKQKQFFDRHAKARPNYYVGDKVYVQTSRNWEPAFITGKAATPRSYYVTTEDGRTLRRNSRVINGRSTNSNRSTASTMSYNYDYDNNVQLPDVPIVTDSCATGDVDEPSGLNDIHTGPHYITRSGRTVHVPQHLNDYECGL